MLIVLIVKCTDGPLMHWTLLCYSWLQGCSRGKATTLSSDNLLSKQSEVMCIIILDHTKVLYLHRCTHTISLLFSLLFSLKYVCTPSAYLVGQISYVMCTSLHHSIAKLAGTLYMLTPIVVHMRLSMLYAVMQLKSGSLHRQLRKKKESLWIVVLLATHLICV